MNIKYIFLLIYTIASIVSSITAAVPDELLDLEKNESQIEIPPLSIMTDNTPNITEITSDENSDNVISQRNEKEINPLEQTKITSEITQQQHVVDDDEENIVKGDDIITQHQSQHQMNISDEEIERKKKEDDVAQENLTIPVFSEWTQMQQLQEKEKKLVELTNSTETNKESKNETLAKHQVIKLRQKNYASPDCGAKILQSNPEAQSSGSVLSDKDEYMLSPCNVERIWFVVELCDSIQAQRVELANFELFSSPLKSLSISVSNRFPAREWTLAGHFDAKTERGVQNFDLRDVSLFGKFVRVDLQYTNTEHYCPLSFFRVFGTSEIEAFEVENEPDGKSMTTIEDDDFVHNQQIESTKSSETNKDNILNRAGAAVMSIVQKAAEVLVKSNGHGAKPNVTNPKQFTENCMSMSHNILCETCSIHERDDLQNFIGCKNFALTTFLEGNERLKNYLINSLACRGILGFDLKNNNDALMLDINYRNFFVSILPQKYIAAMCNMIAKDLKALTVRIENIPEITSNLIPKKDEVSLKNVSKKEEECNQSIEVVAPTEIPTTILSELPTKIEQNAIEMPEKFSESHDEDVKEDNKSKNSSEINIFNKIDRYEGILEVENEPEVIPESTERKVTKEVTTSKEVHIKSNENDTPAEVKTNGERPSNNAPESVFLRLSNRIKTLEKNMTLSTQYLEELSRRYKKQIEDLQTSYSKLQAHFDGLNQQKMDNEKRYGDERLEMKSTLTELDTRSQYMEIILIIFSALLLLQVILVIVLFKRMSILQAAVIGESKLSIDAADKTTLTRKRSKVRIRKISAPNILTQRGAKNDTHQPQLSRTVSAPNKVSEMNENFPTMDESPMLEENDDILIPGFEDLKINNENEQQETVEKKEEYYEEEDTASTASVKTDSQKSLNFRRRLSSPTFLKSKGGSSLKNRVSEPWRKAKSESPPKINNSLNFEHGESPFKTRKNNSFKKLFKKLF